MPRKHKRKPGSDLWLTKDGTIVIGRDYVRQNEIDEAKQKTRARACFRECRTCGACSNSRRDATVTKQYDAHEKRDIDCRKCEPFRFHDCHNGWMRDSHQDAEPFTEDVQNLIDKYGGKPLI